MEDGWQINTGILLLRNVTSATRVVVVVFIVIVIVLSCSVRMEQCCRAALYSQYVFVISLEWYFDF